MHCKSYLHFFSKKFWHICVSLNVNFNKSLTNNTVSFEQLGPDIFSWSVMKTSELSREQSMSENLNVFIARDDNIYGINFKRVHFLFFFNCFYDNFFLTLQMTLQNKT